MRNNITLAQLIALPTFGLNQIKKAALDSYNNGNILEYSLTATSANFRVQTESPRVEGTYLTSYKRIERTTQPENVAMFEKLEKGLYYKHGVLDEAALRKDLDPLHEAKLGQVFDYGTDPELIDILGISAKRTVVFTAMKEITKYDRVGEPVVSSKKRTCKVQWTLFDINDDITVDILMPRKLITTYKDVNAAINKALGFEEPRVVVTQDLFLNVDALTYIDADVIKGDFIYYGTVRVRVSDYGDEVTCFDKKTGEKVDGNGGEGPVDPVDPVDPTDPKLEALSLTKADGSALDSEIKTDDETLEFVVKATPTPADYVGGDLVYRIEGEGAKIDQSGIVTITGITTEPKTITIYAEQDGVGIGHPMVVSRNKVELKSITVTLGGGAPLPSLVETEGTNAGNLTLGYIIDPLNYEPEGEVVYVAVGGDATVDGNLLLVPDVSLQGTEVIITATIDGVTSEAAKVTFKRKGPTKVELTNSDYFPFPEVTEGEGDVITVDLGCKVTPEDYVPVGVPQYELVAGNATIGANNELVVGGVTEEGVEVTVRVELDGVSSENTVLKFKRLPEPEPTLEDIKLTLKDGNPVPAEFQSVDGNCTFEVVATPVPEDAKADDIVFSIEGDGVNLVDSATASVDGKVEIKGVKDADVSLTLVASTAELIVRHPFVVKAQVQEPE